MSAGAEDFIRRETVLAAAPLAPGIALHLATEITPIWQATEERLACAGLAPPFWAFAWPGAQALARHVLDNPGMVSGLRVLDFAAGCGLAAIACARAGAAAVEAAEIDPLAIAAIGLNAAANGVAVLPLARDVVGAAKAWDVVLCGDVCYEAGMAAAIMPWLAALAAAGATVILADPGRAYVPRSGLSAFARYVVPTSRELEDRDSREVTLYRIDGCPPAAPPSPALPQD